MRVLHVRDRGERSEVARRESQTRPRPMCARPLTTTSAGAAPTTASSVPFSRRPPRCVRAAIEHRVAAPDARGQSAPRRLAAHRARRDRGVAGRQGRARPGDPHRTGTDGRRGTRRRRGAHPDDRDHNRSQPRRRHDRGQPVHPAVRGVVAQVCAEARDIYLDDRRGETRCAQGGFGDRGRPASPARTHGDQLLGVGRRSGAGPPRQWRRGTETGVGLSRRRHQRGANRPAGQTLRAATLRPRPTDGRNGVRPGGAATVAGRAP